LLNKVICQHFYRQGVLDIAVELAKEAGIETEDGCREPFTELNNILDSLRQHDLAPALEWAQARRNSLEDHNSTLEFKLHRLHFIGLLQGGVQNQGEAIKYARTHFHQFVRRHETGEKHKNFPHRTSFIFVQEYQTIIQKLSQNGR